VISQAELKSFLAYDRDTGLFTWLVDRGRSAYAGMTAGTPDKAGYIAICINQHTYAAHHLAILYETGEMPSYVDHINRDVSDNRFNNLRRATRSENQQNRLAQSNSKTGIKGVYLRRKGYSSSITKDGTVYRCNFKTLDEAVEWRRTKEFELHPFRPQEQTL
jgi:hypothetical protein